MQNINKYLILLMILSLLGAKGCILTNPESQNSGAVVVEQPSYKLDIQPIFNAYCLLSGCHNEDPSPDGNAADLQLVSWKKVMAGSRNGSIINVLNVDESELLKRLTGTSTRGQKMPPSGEWTPSMVQIQTIRKWIIEGAADN